MEALEFAKIAAGILDSKKAKDVQAVKVDDLTSVTEYFVFAGGTSNTQVRALADEVEFRLKTEYGEAPIHTEGYRDATWIVLDYGYVMIHVFQPTAREFYKIEKLWADGEQVDLSDVLMPD